MRYTIESRLLPRNGARHTPEVHIATIDAESVEQAIGRFAWNQRAIVEESLRPTARGESIVMLRTASGTHLVRAYEEGAFTEL
ncbi:MAG TPA: hypothetical protein VNL91_04730 [Thermoanaerobaculia bacterium]|nr:hypothetical protein [Thermoanaerobaculia bacterium]